MPFAFKLIWQPLYQDRAWQELRWRKLDETGCRCEDCGRHFFLTWFLHLSHNDHDPRNRAWSNLTLRCIPCHNRHDAPHVLAMRRRSRAQKTGQMWLSPEIEESHLPLWAPDEIRARQGEHPNASTDDRWSDPP